MPRVTERGRDTSRLREQARDDEMCRALGKTKELPRALTRTSPAMSALHWFSWTSLTLWHKGCESLTGTTLGLCGELTCFTNASTARVLPNS